jgi:hypothetical protein
MSDVDLDNPNYSEETRNAFDEAFQALYLDVESMNLNYSSITRPEIEQASSDLIARHGAAVEAFENAFVRDEIASGASEENARQRAYAHIVQSVDDIWDVQIDLSR